MDIGLSGKRACFPVRNINIETAPGGFKALISKNIVGQLFGKAGGGRLVRASRCASAISGPARPAYAERPVRTGDLAL